MREIQTPLTTCDIGARYHPVPEKPTLQELTGWDPNTLFLDYMNKVRKKREEELEHAEEDALMAMVDAMNVSQRDRESGRARERAEDILQKASQAISEKTGGRTDPTTTLTVQAILACLGDRFTLEETGDCLEAQRERTEEVTQEQQTSEDPRLERR